MKKLITITFIFVLALVAACAPQGQQDTEVADAMEDKSMEKEESMHEGEVMTDSQSETPIDEALAGSDAIEEDFDLSELDALDEDLDSLEGDLADL